MIALYERQQGHLVRREAACEDAPRRSHQHIDGWAAAINAPCGGLPESALEPASRLHSPQAALPGCAPLPGVEFPASLLAKHQARELGLI